mmetsp:Transcript_161975/g.514650  ORF Transcript_161975/g.514650 Transcript_161975/m.514650 type:complete len:348 (-) Transcript_161975:294-1337(-)
MLDHLSQDPRFRRPSLGWRVRMRGVGPSSQRVLCAIQERQSILEARAHRPREHRRLLQGCHGDVVTHAGPDRDLVAARPEDHEVRLGDLLAPHERHVPELRASWQGQLAVEAGPICDNTDSAPLLERRPSLGMPLELVTPSGSQQHFAHTRRRLELFREELLRAPIVASVALANAVEFSSQVHGCHTIAYAAAVEQGRRQHVVRGYEIHAGTRVMLPLLLFDPLGVDLTQRGFPSHSPTERLERTKSRLDAVHTQERKGEGHIEASVEMPGSLRKLDIPIWSQGSDRSSGVHHTIDRVEGAAIAQDVVHLNDEGETVSPDAADGHSEKGAVAKHGLQRGAQHGWLPS